MMPWWLYVLVVLSVVVVGLAAALVALAVTLSRAVRFPGW